jgi:hypothetical protein
MNQRMFGRDADGDAVATPTATATHAIAEGIASVRLRVTTNPGAGSLPDRESCG